MHKSILFFILITFKILAQDNSNLIFGPTLVNGCKFYDLNIVYDNLLFKQGQKFDELAIATSIKNLKMLNFYKDIKISHAKFSNNLVGTIFTVFEDDPAKLGFRYGMGQSSQNFTMLPTWNYKTGLDFIYRNPCKLGDVVKIDIEVDRFYRNFLFQYNLPIIFNGTYHSFFSLYNSNLIQPIRTKLDKVLYNEIYNGINLGFNKIINTGIFRFYLGLELIKMANLPKSISQVIKFNENLIGKSVPYFIFNPFFLIEKANDKFCPISGYVLLINIKTLITSLKNGSFAKFLFDSSYFYSLNHRCISAFRLRLGHIFYSNFENVRPTERFFLGGPDSVRGYEPHMVPPINCYKDNKCINWVPVGAATMVNLNSELRILVKKSLFGVIFNDLGILSNNIFESLRTFNFVTTFGFGLRYLSFLGPIRFDIGFKLKKRCAEDRVSAWYITFGYGF